jgi:hypothetical protein
MLFLPALEGRFLTINKVVSNVTVGYEFLTDKSFEAFMNPDQLGYTLQKSRLAQKRTLTIDTTTRIPMLI